MDWPHPQVSEHRDQALQEEKVHFDEHFPVEHPFDSSRAPQPLESASPFTDKKLRVRRETPRPQGCEHADHGPHWDSEQPPIFVGMSSSVATS